MHARRLVVFVIAALAPLPAAAQGAADDAQWNNARIVTVQTSNFRFDPAEITLQHGEAYDLRIENVASGGHDFAAKAFFTAARVREADRAKIARGVVALDAGESVQIRLIAPPPGVYDLRCTHFMHSTFGMTGKIVVQ